MKIRHDFVTNSSSSSFVIATNETIPEIYKNRVEEITSENLIDKYKERVEFDYIVGYSEEDDNKLKRVAKLNDEQILLIKLAVHDELDEYLEVKEKLESEEFKDKKIYYIFEDRDWLYDQIELTNFINNSEIISHETDL